MKIIQYILIFLSLIPFLLFKYGGKTLRRASYRIGFIIFIILFLIAVVFPNLTTNVANVIGVGRGTDLVVYLTSFALICFSIVLVIKFEQLQREITQLVRELALDKEQNSDHEI
jgi:hypothetical protein